MTAAAAPASRIPPLLWALLAVTGLVWLSRHNYLLYHSLVELFSVVIAFGAFVLAWHTRSVTENGYLLFLGVAFLFVAAVDTLHLFAFKGMGVFPAAGADLPTQLWVIGRYLQAAALLLGLRYLQRLPDPRLVLAGFGALTLLLLAALFGGRFPHCFVTGEGLTPFKIGSEYLVVAVTGAALVLLRRGHSHLPGEVRGYLQAALALTMAQEFAFTLYQDVYGIGNMVGHLFKVAVYYCIYRAIIETGLRAPYTLLFYRLKESNDSLAAANRELAQAKEAAEAGSRAKSRFLAGMSHELRTPLNAILGFGQLLQREEGLSPTAREELGIIAASGEHLLSLIGDVLDMAKIEAGRTTLEEEAVEPARLLEEVVGMMAQRAEAKGLAFSFELGGGLPPAVRIDARKVRQVLINLIGNAIKFTDEGGVAVRARREEGGGGSWLEVEVEDSGRGIAPADQARIFEPFVQAGGGEGSGLGLPITREFVELLGGSIELRSTPGRGSLFAFRLPLQPASAGGPAATGRQPRVLSLAPGEPPWRVLAVDDTASGRRLLRRLLGAVGFEVREAADGAEALALVASFHPHLVWMDMRMPVMDGFEAARRIKAGPGGDAVVVLALSASSFRADRERALAAGCADLLRKPFREGELFEAMARHLGCRYLYEARSERSAPHGTALETGRREVAVALRALPAEVTGPLRRALVVGEVAAVRQAVEAAGRFDPALAVRLRGLAEAFRYDEMAAALLEPRDDGGGEEGAHRQGEDQLAVSEGGQG